MVGLTRRALLERGVVGGAGLIVVACGGGGAPAARTPAQADSLLLADAYARETTAARRLRALAPGVRGDARRLVDRLAAGDERHAEALRSAVRELGGPDPVGGRGGAGASSRTAGLAGALEVADTAASAHLDLLPRLRVPEARTLVAFVLAEEAAHAAALRSALGRPPVPGAFL